MVSAPRWAGAMLAADLSKVSGGISDVLNIGNTVSGFAMGILEVVAVAYMLDAIRTMKSHQVSRSGVVKINFKFYGVLGFVSGIMVITPFILSPYLVSRMMSQEISATLGTMIMRYAWAFAVVVAPLFVVGGVAFARPGVMGVQSGGSQQVIGEKSHDLQSSDGKEKFVAKKRKGSSIVCDVCGYEATNRYSLAAHKKIHTGKKARREKNESENTEIDNVVPVETVLPAIEVEEI